MLGKQYTDIPPSYLAFLNHFLTILLDSVGDLQTIEADRKQMLRLGFHYTLTRTARTNFLCEQSLYSMGWWS